MERHRIVRANGWDISNCNASKSVNTNLAALKTLNFDRSDIGVGAANEEHSGQYMLDLATDTRFEEMLRFGFLQNYLNAADAEGVKDALIRFLVGDARMKHRHLVYVYAMAVYGQTDNADTRRAIIAALLVAAGREEVLDVLVELDGMLAARSDTYRRSRQRFALLNWHALKLPTGNPQVDNPLKIALAEVASYWKHTDVNMSLALLQARDFSQSLTPQESEKWGGPLRVPRSVSRDQALAMEAKALLFRVVWPYAAGAFATLVMAAFGFWLHKRRSCAGRS
jgi:hypothetical protein